MFILFVNYFQASPPTVPLQTVRPRAFNMGIAGLPPLIPPAMRRSLPPPPFPVHRPPQIPVNRPPPRPLYEFAEQRFRPAVHTPVFRPQPPPEQCRQFHDPSRLDAPCAEQRFRPAVHTPVFRPQPPPEQCQQFHDPSRLDAPLQYPCRPPAVLPYEPRFLSCVEDTGAHVYPRMECQPLVPRIRQPFLPPRCPPPQPLSCLIGMPVPGQLSAPVVPVASLSYEMSSSESVFSMPAALNQATGSSALSESVETQSQTVLPICSRNVDNTPQKSSDNGNSLSSSTYDEHASRRRWRQRRASETPPRHSWKSQNSRDSRSDRSSQRDTHRDSSRQRYSRFENRYKTTFTVFVKNF